jgi:hypothetical protein
MNAVRSAALVRRWVALYTLGLPSELKQDRRDEIDDDLWCQAQDAAASGRADRSLGSEILTRLVFGVPADVSWRIEQRRRPSARVLYGKEHAMYAPGTGLLAIIAGIGWAVYPIPQGIVGRDWPAGDPISAVLFASMLAGTFGVAGALIGLVLAVHDKVRAWVPYVAATGMVVALLELVGMYLLVFLLPIISSVVLWQLGRIGAVGTWQARAHIGAAVLFLAPIGGLALNPGLFDSQATSVPLMSLLIPYGISWIAIGSSLFLGAARRAGQPTGA